MCARSGITISNNIYVKILKKYKNVRVVQGRGVLERAVRAVHLAPPRTSSCLKYVNLFRFTLIYLSLIDIFEPLAFVYPPFLAYFWLRRYRLFIYSLYF
jgi:hypothetical protein